MLLSNRIPAAPDPDAIFEAFVDWSVERGWQPYPAQTEALIEIVSGSNVIMATPTGSGKSLVATGAQFATLAAGGTTYYTAPIKALVSEKFFAATEFFGPERVGMLTGDASVNAGAPIICCTAEVLANIALRQGDRGGIDTVIMDEFHYYAEPDRGWAWQVPLIELPSAQFLLMSATLGDMTRFEADLSRRTGRQTAVVSSVERPIPLYYSYVTTTLHETIEERLESRDAPIYVVHFSRAAAIEQAQAMASLKVATREEKDKIAELIGDFRFSAGFGKTLSRLVRMGIGVHHSGMLPRYRRLVERLAQAGLLKIICGTDTLGVGINVPIRTVLLTSLSKYDGVKPRLLTAREFHQIAGRAGRAGYDTAGNVVIQAPDHVVANEKALAKAGDDPKKRRKVVRKRPPEGTVGYGQPTYDRLVAAEPEPLESSFGVSHAMVINVIARGGDCFAGMRHLLTGNDEPAARRRRHVHRTIEIYRGLLATGIVEPNPSGTGARLTIDLQEDFALNQPLSPFALAALDLLDPESDDYTMDIVSVIESILEDPRPVLTAQRNRARGAAVEAMKAEGIEYEERMELLEDVTHPQPLAEQLGHAYTVYAQTHPWVLDHRLSPKSVVRELSEQAMTFSEYVSNYQLARSEGIVLRYLSDAYKALRQTVPESMRTPDLADLITWLGEMIRQVDSSLVDEWEELRHPGAQPKEHRIDERPAPVTQNQRAFAIMVRNAMFRRVELAARRRWDDLGALDGDAGWTADDWWNALKPYFERHGEIGTGPDARGPQLLALDRSEDVFRVRQTLDDPAGDRDWVIEAEVDLAASDEAGEAVVRVTRVGELSGFTDES
ncbi:DEAD/DEAH box helicase [Microlunatus sp. GCM10028923]|uniref:DEAD/DEAH box helicase n=1 Tax=Microlunatus sp. GCM10028923 TaxID=3273400 RepID=UPI00360A6E7F